ncbi:MAG TPA: YbjN domain-containing protein [Chitinophagales bacterium]|nr:YbjN domain-containing protein [Chitinophagales bacterium]
MNEVLKKYFDDKGWKYSNAESESIFFFGISGVNLTIHCTADLDEEKKRFLFCTEASVSVPEEKRRDIAELLTRFNYGTFLGNFEMNFENGRIQFRTSIVYDSIELTDILLGNLIMNNIISMDLSFPSIQKVLEEDQTPLDAYLFMQGQIDALKKEVESG